MNKIEKMCKVVAKNRKIPRNCRMCGASWHSTKEHLKKAILARGPRTQEHNKKISMALRGRVAWNKGIKGSVPGKSSNPVIEARRKAKISAHHKGREQPWCTGKNHWRWKGGKQSNYASEFRRLRVLVIARDGKCMQCGATKEERRLVAHHINHDRSHNYLDNLITLCHEDNVRAEAKLFYTAWQKKFKEYTQKIEYQLEVA